MPPPPPFHLHTDPSSRATPTPARIALTVALGALLPLVLVVGRDRLRRIIGVHAERRKLRRIACEVDRRKDGGGGGDGEGGEGGAVVSGLFVHPVKSLRPVPVPSSTASPLGLDGDRRLMLVRPRPPSPTGSYDPDGPTHRFVTQRQCPALATIEASLPTTVGGGGEEEGGDIPGSVRGRRGGWGDDDYEEEEEVSADDGEKTVIRLSSSLAPDEKVYVNVSARAVASYPVRYRAGLWDDVVEVADVGDDAARFVAKVISAASKSLEGGGGNDDVAESFDDVRLASILPSTLRPLDARYLPPAALTSLGSVPHTSLNDGFPMLVACESSLEELNRRMIERGRDPIPMSRFRPNVVIRGTRPFEEDTWRAVRIGGPGGLILHVVKGCPRCKQSCTNQVTGRRHTEPLETLATFRALNPRGGEDVYFGQNAVPQGGGGSVVRVGDAVDVLTRGEPVWDVDAVRAE